MKILKARITKRSCYFENGRNLKNKPVWLKITDFRAEGEKNYQIEAIKEIKNGFPVYFKVWVSKDEIVIKQFEDGQLSLFD